MSSVQGLASGIQWQDIVDQLTALDTTRELTPITNAISANTAKTQAWNNYKTLAQKLSDAVAGFRDGTALDGLQVAGGTSASSGRALLSASASTTAVPGDYQVQVLALAQAQKVSGNAIASASAVLGLSGDIAINGHKITVSASDSLAAIRDTLNAANSGKTATGVTATILSTANGSSRLVLTSDNPGARGIEMIDSATSGGVLQQLGIVDGAFTMPSNISGGSTSGSFATGSVAAALSIGLGSPPAAFIRVGNISISVNLATDSLSTIAARIQAAGIGARVVQTVTSGGTSNRLVVDANVSAAPSAADASLPDADSLRSLQLLGFAQGGRSSVAQDVSSGALLDGSNAPATTSTLLSDIKANGSSANIQAGDTINLNGRRGDGTAVSLSYVVGAGSTLNDLLTQINGVASFGGATRPATATIGADGSIHLTDGTGGDSQLAVSLGVTKSVANGGGSTGIGAFQTNTVGRLREVVAGSDASIRVDGVLLTRSTNSITDAIGGVTMKLQQAEVGTSVSLSVTRATDSAVVSAQTLAKAYNDLMSFASATTAQGGDLANNGSIRSSARALTKSLLTDIVGSSFTRPTLAGMSLSKTGILSVDTAAFTAALKSDPAGVRGLFALTGTVTGSSLEYVAAGDKVATGSYAVNITSPATTPSVTSSGATLPFNDGGIARTLALADNSTGKSGNITLATGDDATAISTKLNAMFATNGLHLTASVSAGALKITNSQYGTASSFAISYDALDITSSAQLGIAGGTFAGTDAQGTINGVVAVGLGQTLTGAAKSDSDGLVVRYFGSTAGPAGSTKVSVGTGALLSRLSSFMTLGGDGLVDTVTAALDISSAGLQRRSADVADRIARHKTALLAQFAAMEKAIGRIQAQGTQMTSMINALTVKSSN
ncbi:MAG: flagellar filament capping protein FliD [bacterium]